MADTQTLRQDAEHIISGAVAAVLPDTAVLRCLEEMSFPDGKIILIAVGKAAAKMADAAYGALGERIDSGLVITKYGHGTLSDPPYELIEAGHPVPDENAFAASHCAIEMVSSLTDKDTVLFLLSGGGSALFELSDLSMDELKDISRQLLHCGADIGEVNTIRKRLSRVKGGRFALLAAPAQVKGIILSDVVGDRIDMIASGPVSPDLSSCADALRIVEKYHLRLSGQALALLHRETPKELPFAETMLCGSVRDLCAAAVKLCRDLGYETTLLTDHLDGEAKEAGERLSKLAGKHRHTDRPLAFVAGGETVVHLTGDGLGGRNQELALAAATGIDGYPNAAVFSIGSDGTDGPTDAAGGYVDGMTCRLLKENGIDIGDVLARHDSYHALLSCGGLIITGPTGTNVNDLSVLLIRPEDRFSGR